MSSICQMDYEGCEICVRYLTPVMGGGGKVYEWCCMWGGEGGGGYSCIYFLTASNLIMDGSDPL